ncbi:GIY-YIG nuclease family protein [Pseudomonas sp. GM55]|uniref:GIY-YIG nuclease family protein n=1 Tax=Pseudomonas sp. GM55 TaxID=1144333 RepID=UPI000270AF18|nr:GIY-YIG nuclease family protein [Pseudomonas sp. GM55]EJM73376.1 hypothetical protein PMI31_03140 [Pseudomonas sp. GM55]
MRRYRVLRPHQPAQKNGNLYYVRLNTPLGIFYKLGFTSLESVAKRLGYQGTGDEAYIDEVLYFVYHENAFDLETTLHAHFASQSVFRMFSAAPDMPLCGNGQSELYYDDILGLDSAFTKEQSEKTRSSVKLAILMRTWSSEETALKQKAFDDAKERFVEDLFSRLRSGLQVIAPVINWLFGTRLFQDTERAPSADASIALGIIENFKYERRLKRQSELYRLRKEAREEMERMTAAAANTNFSQP